MSGASLARRAVAEALGTGLLVATVVGSGIMAETLSRDVAVQLLCNALPTGAALVVLITILGPLSGAHFNPAVSLLFAWRGDLKSGDLPVYVLAQIAGGIAGTILAQAMFGLPFVEMSTKVRSGAGLWIAEMVATSGLVLTIFGGLRFAAGAIPMLVGLYITAAYWFTASTSFANPAVTLARTLTNSFSGIRLADAPAFIAVQCAAAAAAYLLAHWLFAEEKR